MFSQNTRVPLQSGYQTAMPYDAAVFNAIQYGPATSGWFQAVATHYHNADGLSTSSEKIDAFEIGGPDDVCWGEPISTVGKK